VIGESIEAGSRRPPLPKDSEHVVFFRSSWLRPNARLRSNAFSRSAGNCIRFRRIGKPPSSNPIAYSQFAAVDNRKKWFVNKFMPASLFERIPKTELSGGHLPPVFPRFVRVCRSFSYVCTSPFRHGGCASCAQLANYSRLVTSLVFFASHVLCGSRVPAFSKWQAET